MEQLSEATKLVTGIVIWSRTHKSYFAFDQAHNDESKILSDGTV